MLTDPSEKEVSVDVKIGKTAVLRSGIIGTVKFIGRLPQRRGVCVGIDVSNCDGLHNGSFRGRRYFNTTTAHSGVFAPKSAVISTYDGEEEERRRQNLDLIPEELSGKVQRSHDSMLTSRSSRLSHDFKSADAESMDMSRSDNRRLSSPSLALTLPKSIPTSTTTTSSHVLYVDVSATAPGSQIENEPPLAVSEGQVNSQSRRPSLLMSSVDKYLQNFPDSIATIEGERSEIEEIQRDYLDFFTDRELVCGRSEDTVGVAPDSTDELRDLRVETNWTELGAQIEHGTSLKSSDEDLESIDMCDFIASRQFDVVSDLSSHVSCGYASISSRPSHVAKEHFVRAETELDDDNRDCVQGRERTLSDARRASLESWNSIDSDFQFDAPSDEYADASPPPGRRTSFDCVDMLRDAETFATHGFDKLSLDDLETTRVSLSDYSGDESFPDDEEDPILGSLSSIPENLETKPYPNEFEELRATVILAIEWMMSDHGDDWFSNECDITPDSSRDMEELAIGHGIVNDDEDSSAQIDDDKSHAIAPLAFNDCDSSEDELSEHDDIGVDPVHDGVVSFTNSESSLPPFMDFPPSPQLDTTAFHDPIESPMIDVEEESSNGDDSFYSELNHYTHSSTIDSPPAFPELEGSYLGSDELLYDMELEDEERLTQDETQNLVLRDFFSYMQGEVSEGDGDSVFVDDSPSKCDGELDVVNAHLGNEHEWYADATATHPRHGEVVSRHELDEEICIKEGEMRLIADAFRIQSDTQILSMGRDNCSSFAGLTRRFLTQLIWNTDRVELREMQMGHAVSYAGVAEDGSAHDMSDVIDGDDGSYVAWNEKETVVTRSEL